MTAAPRGPVGVHHVRVRYAETDQMGVAHHGSYVPWLEEARTEWIRERGTSYRALEEGGLALSVARLQIRYVRSARYDDVVRIETWLAEEHKASVTLRYRLYATGERVEDRRGPLIAEAETRLALIGPDRRPMRVPPALFSRPEPD